jgi:hypothetical protein
VRDVGAYRALNDVAMRDAIARGDFPGPRMLSPVLTSRITGGAPDVQLPWDLHYGQADSPWESSSSGAQTRKPGR